MIPINVIFKLIKNNPDSRSISIKMCRQNAQTPIDEYPSLKVSYDKLDFSSLYNLRESLRHLTMNQALMQLLDEEILPENESTDELDSLDLNQCLNKVISLPCDEHGFMQEIEL